MPGDVVALPGATRDIGIDDDTWGRLCEIANELGEDPNRLAWQLLDERSRDLAVKIADARAGGVGGHE